MWAESARLQRELRAPIIFRMTPSLRHPVALALLSGAALLGTNCGGGDDSPGSSGGSAGTKSGGNGGSSAKGGSGGKGGASGSNSKGGTNGNSGSNGDGGDGADSSSGGTGTSAGGSQSAGGSGNAGGGAGDTGGTGDVIALTDADSASELIVADEGGTVTLGDLTLVIPADALAEDTTITIRSFEESRSVFVLEPDGLQFETPITARFTIPAAELDGAGVEGLPVFVLETGSLDEPLTLVASSSIAIDDDDNFIAEAELSHFSGILPRVVSLPINGYDFVSIDDLTVHPAIVPVGVQFGVVGMLGAPSRSPFEVGAVAYKGNGSHEDFAPVKLTPVGVSVYGSQTRGFTAVHEVPRSELLFDAPVAVQPGNPLMLTRQFECTEAGGGGALTQVLFTAEFDATSSGYGVRQDEARRVSLVPGLSGSTRIKIKSSVRLPYLAVTCLDTPSSLTSLGAPAQLDPLIARYKAAMQQHCFWLSNHDSCQMPDPARAIITVLDPVLEVGPQAAARLEAAFPCGDGPAGQTFCGTPGAFAEGDYVFLVATFGDDIPLDDDTSSFQHAFVFDADGDPDNNYVPPSAYPDDFFGGTDKWYQLFYTPQQGFTLKVVDARISTSNPVASSARLVIAGRELTAFIPRAELDGTDPGFRVSTFRHEGDYGLDGGPWDASYYPPLDEPLMPAAAGDTVVLPED